MESSSGISNTPSGNQKQNNIISLKEYKIDYLDESIKILIGKTKENIIIISSYYEIKLSPQELSIITKLPLKTINDAFNFIEDIFENKSFKITNITPNELTIKINIFDIITGNKKDISLILEENIKDNTKSLIQELFEKNIELKKEIKRIKEENFNLKKAIDNLKESDKKNNEEINVMKNNQIIIMNKLSQLEININQQNFNNFGQFGFQNFGNNNSFGQFNRQNQSDNINSYNINDYIYPIKKEEGEEEEEVVINIIIIYNQSNCTLLSKPQGTILNLINMYKNKLFLEGEFVLTLNSVILTNDLTLEEAKISDKSKLILFKSDDVPKYFKKTTLKHKAQPPKKEKKNSIKITEYTIPTNNYNGEVANIIFKGSNFSLIISTPAEVKVKNLISKFFTLTRKYKEAETFFIFNSLKLNNNEEKTISEKGLKNLDKIQVINTGKIIGA